MAGFLGLNKKIAGGAVKPVAPAKPSIKPVVTGVKPSIKPVVAPIKTGVKPATIKPTIKPVQKEEEVKPVEAAVETTAENTVESKIEPVVVAQEVKPEETVSLTPVETSETVEETTEEVVEEIEAIVETTETTEVVEATEETKEETKEEVKSETKTDIPQGYTEEEWNALSPQKRGAITRKKNQEEKKSKDTNKDSNNETNKEVKAQTKDQAYIPEQIPQRSQIPYEEVLSAVIISSAGKEWDMQVAELTQALKAITIEPDMNSATMKYAMADLVALKDAIFHEYTLSKTVLEGTERKIDMVKTLNAKGSSSDERKLNSAKACIAYQEDGIAINLYELLDVASAKFNFYSELMKQIEFKAKSLITMNGALKLEKDALGSQL